MTATSRMLPTPDTMRAHDALNLGATRATIRPATSGSSTLTTSGRATSACGMFIDSPNRSSSTRRLIGAVMIETSADIASSEMT